MANTLQAVVIGRGIVSAEAFYGSVDSGDSRAFVLDASAYNVWVNALEAVVRKHGATAGTVRISAYDTDSSLVPRTRLGYASAQNVPSSFALVNASVGHADNAPTNTAFKVTASQHTAVDLLALSQDLDHSMAQAADVTEDSEVFYNRASVSNPPPSAFGSYSSSIEGAGTVNLRGWRNVKPEKPSTAAGMSPSGTITDTAPTFTAAFRDLCGAYGASSGLGLDLGDRLDKYQIQVAAVSAPSTLLWSTAAIEATSGEITGNQVSIAYGGSTLTRGTQYQWRIRMTDQFGEWSDWSNWITFTPASLGFVTIGPTPTGNVDAISGSTALDFTAKYNHQSSLSTNAVQIKLLDVNGTQLQISSTIAKTVASAALPGTAFTITWAQSGFTALKWGKTYQFAIRARDTNNVWSDWSAPLSFSTDKAPSIPSNLIPSGGDPYGSRPLLSAIFGDDDDSYAGTLTGVVRITRPNLTTVDVTPTYNATTNRWEFQTTSSEVSASGTYSHAWTGYDGTLYSGEKTTLGAAIFSAPQTFAYGSYPSVTITSPADLATITSPSFTVAWTTTGQVKYRVTVIEVATGDHVYDTGTVTSAATSHVVPSGYVHNSRDYEIRVYITNSTPLTGVSAVTTVTISITPPNAPANFQAVPARRGIDQEPSAIRLSWDPVTISSGSFICYRIFMQADGGPDVERIILAELTSISDSSLFYNHPASGFEYTFGIQVVTLDGLDEIESDDSVFATATVDLLATVLSHAANPGTYRAILTNVTDYRDSYTDDQAPYVSPAKARPNTINAETNYRTRSITAVIKTTDKATAKEHRDNLFTLNAQLDVICIRNADGDKFFGMLTGLTIEKIKGTDAYEASFMVREEDLTEGLGAAP